MTTPEASFYVTGGTLRQDAPSYVERQADRDLYEGLLRGEFCYVLTSRQMGKSSLMVHTAVRLRATGVAVVVLDLTAIGQNLTAEQWYGGLLRRVGLQLDPDGELEEELDDLWFDQQERVGPLERWMTALQRLVLPRASGRIVLFIDEIDAVRSLPFSTDEFFAAIRECYNRRSQDPAFERLTFCLLGVASPSDLIQDTRITPFNIGQRIELTDFTEAEAVPLAEGLVGGEALDQQPASELLHRILSWTGGHPYLTQRLCQSVAQDADNPQSEIHHPKSTVDRDCEALFLSPSAREKDDNLLFVRERLLHSEADRASLLDLYAQVRAGKRVGMDDTNPLIDLLRLSGVARAREGRLHVRNRIYARVFDRAWITQHMPDAELRRQRAAYRRGLLRATAVAAVVVAALTTLAAVAITQAHRAQEGQRELRRHLYASQMNAVQQAWSEGNLPRAQALLDAQRPAKPGDEDLRGFEWRCFWRLCRGDERMTFPEPSGWVRSVALSSNGRLLAAGSHLDKAVRLWDVARRRLVATLTGFKEGVSSVAFSPDGRLLAGASGAVLKPQLPGEVKLWDVAAPKKPPRERGALPHPHSVNCLAFSPDGKLLATGSRDSTVWLWDVATRKEVARLRGGGSWVASLGFSRDGKLLAAASSDGTIRLWNTTTRREAARLEGRVTYVPCSSSLALSPRGDFLAVCGQERPGDAKVEVWDLAAKRVIKVLMGRGTVAAAAFSPDGRVLVTVSASDSAVRTWDVKTWQERFTLTGRTGPFLSIAFSPDGRTLATGGYGNAVALWDLTPKRAVETIAGSQQGITALAFSPDGKTLASYGSAEAKLWDVATRRERAALKGQPGSFSGLAFSPNGRQLAVGNGNWPLEGADKSSGEGELKLWEQERSDARGGPPRVAAILERHVPVACVAFSPDGKLLASSGFHNPVGWRPEPVRLWDVASGRELARLNTGGGATDLSFSPDGKTIAVGTFPLLSIGPPHEIQLWDLSGYPPTVSGRRRAVLKGHSQRLLTVAFSPDGKLLASGSSDQTVKLWDPATRRELATLSGHLGAVSQVRFSPDGKTLASAGGDGLIPLWNVAAREQAATLRGHRGEVSAIAFSPDGTLLASGGTDTTIRLWRAAPFSETDAPAAVPGQ